MIAFDSDIFSEYLFGNVAIVERIEAIPKIDQALPIVVIEEALRGRLNTIRQAGSGKARVELPQAFELFEKTLEALVEFTVLSYTDAAHAEFLRLKSMKIRVGSQDLKIASIAVAHDAKLISRNRRDFELVPGLKLELWN